MYTAINKRKENIAEYILYLWQLEDLLRALQFSPEAIYSQLVAPRGLDAAREQELLGWYIELAKLMETEGKQEQGHLQHTLHIIADMQNLHMQLLRLPQGEEYSRLFAVLSPELSRLREIVSGSERLDDEQMSDIELLFRTLYAVMLYKIKGDEAAQKIIGDVLETVSPVIAELALKYRQVEQGEIDLFGQENGIVDPQT